VHDTFERIHTELRKRGITPVYYAEHGDTCSMNLEWVSNNVHSLMTVWNVEDIDFDVVNGNGTVLHVWYGCIERWEEEAVEDVVNSVDNFAILITASATIKTIKGHLESQGLSPSLSGNCNGQELSLSWWDYNGVLHGISVWTDDGSVHARSHFGGKTIYKQTYETTAELRLAYLEVLDAMKVAGQTANTAGGASC
jgi:hypothetical protein